MAGTLVLDDATGTLDIANNFRLGAGGLTVTAGTLEFSSGNIVAGSTGTITNAGTILVASGQNYDQSTGTTTNNALVIVDAASRLAFSNTFVNNGSVVVNGGSFAVDGTFTNNTGATVTVNNGAHFGTGYVVTGAGSLVFGTGIGNGIDFDRPQTVSTPISGMVAGDFIELSGASRTTLNQPTYSNGVLTYTDGTNTWTITLTGIAAGTQFRAFVDPLGLDSGYGIDITIYSGHKAASDLFGIGQSSIVWINTSTGETDTWMMAGGQVATATPLLGNAAWTLVGTGDFAGSGNAQLLWSNGTQVIGWSDTNDTSQALLINDSSMSVVGVGDFNGDGKSDILWQNAAGEVDDWTMNGFTKISTSTVLGASAMKVVGVGDFNGNGTDDILFRNNVTGEVDLGIMNNGTLTSDTAIMLGGTTGLAWTVAGVGDFTGDGTSDILWRNVATGEVDMWIMKNGAISSAVGVLPGSTWSVVGVGDYNGDGTSDILWHNATNGETDMWLMKNGVPTSTSGLLVSTTWTPDTHLLTSAT